MTVVKSLKSGARLQGSKTVYLLLRCCNYVDLEQEL